MARGAIDYRFRMCQTSRRYIVHNFHRWKMAKRIIAESGDEQTPSAATKPRLAYSEHPRLVAHRVSICTRQAKILEFQRHGDNAHISRTSVWTTWTSEQNDNKFNRGQPKQIQLQCAAQSRGLLIIIFNNNQPIILANPWGWSTRKGIFSMRIDPLLWRFFRLSREAFYERSSAKKYYYYLYAVHQVRDRWSRCGSGFIEMMWIRVQNTDVSELTGIAKELKRVSENRQNNSP
jgi:hypothetical protein